MLKKILEQEIGYTFNDKNILKKALTHASKSMEHLERQEFLGDAVLGLVIAQYLYETFPKLAEGDLSKMRANLVCKTALLMIADQWDIVDFLDVGDGERSPQGRLKSLSISANAVESIIGAVFQDGGWHAAKEVVLKAWQNTLQDVKPVNLRDAKSELQELTQAHALGLPTYKITDLGLNHVPRFQADCYLQQHCLGIGRGDRKKTAEIHAARKAVVSETLLQMISNKTPLKL